MLSYKIQNIRHIKILWFENVKKILKIFNEGLVDLNQTL